jgi:hypothetical protein
MENVGSVMITKGAADQNPPMPLQSRFCVRSLFPSSSADLHAQRGLRHFPF